MKIGTVCQTTGLTDRTIRYYIEEGLLQPACTKNHLGRKSFDFTQEHVTLLHQISVLRKYGFSITDIKTILADPRQSSQISQELIEKKKKTIKTEQVLLDTLLQLDKQKNYTLPELADALDSPALADVMPPKDNDSAIIVPFFWCICILEVAVGIPVTTNAISTWSKQFLFIQFYPLSGIQIWGFFRYFYPLICAGIMIILHKTTRKNHVLHGIFTRLVSIIYLITWLPLAFSTFWNPIPPIYSETTDIQNYMQIGSIEQKWVNTNLFPEEVPADALAKEGKLLPDTTRYYNITEMFFEGHCELLAQWQLSPEDLDAEKARLEKTYSGQIQHILKNEEWTCWIFNVEYPPKTACLLESALNDQPPQECGSYYLECFAFRENDGLVRYISSYSGGSNINIPVFMQLNWE